MGYFSNYPKCVFFILGCEFCERFSYYGMKAILVLFLTRAMLLDDSTATAIYHAFNFTCYFTPIFGALIADGWLGKYKTILYISILYAFGNIVMSVSSIPFTGTYSTWAPYIGLTLIAIGTGGIKPCVAAFGGDQFNDEQKRQKDSFFSVFYMSINLGSLLSMIITPILRSEVYCFDDNCWALAFGVPAALMVVALIFFVLGTRWYTSVPAGQNVIGDLCSCVGVAIKNRCKRSKGEEKEHWLDYAEGRFDKKFIKDCKAVMGVLYMFLPFPVFWSLYDQQGSRWTLQAGQLNGDFGNGFVIEPDLIQVLNPVLVLLWVPVLESLVFPCFAKLKIPDRPLVRFGVGMTLAAIAFFVAAILQAAIDNTLPPTLEGGHSRIKVINAIPCGVDWNLTSDSLTEPNTLGIFESASVMDVLSGDTSFAAQFHSACNLTGSGTLDISLMAGQSYTIILAQNHTTAGLDIFNLPQDLLGRTGHGLSSVRVVNTLNGTVDVKLLSPDLTIDADCALCNVATYGWSKHLEVHHTDFPVDYRFVEDSINGTAAQFMKLFKANGADDNELISKAGAVYTMVTQRDTNGQAVFTQHTDVPPNQVNILWMIPQYFVMTLAECFFSITGLSFAYSQSPASMKSVLQAAWLLTSAIGNIIIIIVSLIKLPSQVGEYILFACLMLITMVIYAIMACFYKYVELDDEPEKLKLEGEVNYGLDDEKSKEAEYYSTDPMFNIPNEESFAYEKSVVLRSVSMSQKSDSLANHSSDALDTRL